MPAKYSRKFVVLLMGPTTSGKSKMATVLCKRLPMEIVSVDSAQIYRKMDIGTAKPDRQTREKYKHHLIDIINPNERYSASSFRQDALRVISAIHERGKVPLLVGGTMMYFKFLIDGAADLPAPQLELREALNKEASLKGWPHLHKTLTKIDPVTASRISTNDSQRIQRALEVFYLTNKTIAEIQKLHKPRKSPFLWLKTALTPTRLDQLEERIATRFRLMVEKGLLREVEEIRDKFNLNQQMPSMRCVGYRQAWQYLDKKITKDEFIKLSILATRQLAKRQITWLRKEKAMHFECTFTDVYQIMPSWMENQIERAKTGILSKWVTRH